MHDVVGFIMSNSLKISQEFVCLNFNSYKEAQIFVHSQSIDNRDAELAKTMSCKACLVSVEICTFDYIQANK
jgi:hypothetical protein